MRLWRVTIMFQNMYKQVRDMIQIQYIPSRAILRLNSSISSFMLTAIGQCVSLIIMSEQRRTLFFRFLFNVCVFGISTVAK